MGRRLILDINVLIAYERGTIDRSALGDGELAVAAITIADLPSRDRTGRHRRTHRLAGTCSGRDRKRCDALAYTPTTAAHRARLIAHLRRTDTRRGAHDLLIAAHTAETGRTVVTSDLKASFTDLPGVLAVDIP
ncbi:type II toxin-antitoxin system VapC family toxin [Parafrankia sp. EUN1f]|uniref:type II toxin-antitoxin system VapC family toxin n=1 Tax=Parafrankia sp. EUN1f TaxID=102897 RepID=UPI0001C443A4|nr:PIN domain-containing protein [Parafrankia sp. EUN1f]EFC82509.1 PilT protein-like protein [Parafrankia sp. EUN1f]